MNNKQASLNNGIIFEDNKTSEFEEAIFGMGCFWCGEDAFHDNKTNEKLPGIISTVVGYAGFLEKKLDEHDEDNLIEVVKILFDPNKIRYQEILNIFWYNIDPFDNKGQFCDRGMSYVSKIFYKNNNQLTEAKKSKEEKERLLGKKILTNIEPVLPFRIADEHHQGYKVTNPVKYQYYRWNCGRDRKLQEIWGVVKIQEESFLFQKRVELTRILEEA